MGAWRHIWSRLMVDERRLAAHENIIQAEKMPEASQSILEFLARDARTTPDAVARWSLEKRADRLSRAPGIHPTNLGVMIAMFLVKHQAPMIARMLDIAEVPNANGVIDARTQTEPVTTEQLARGIRAIESEFPPRDVSIYLDAMEAQGLALWKNVAEARRVAKAAPGSDSEPRPAAGGAAPSLTPTPSPAVALPRAPLPPATDPSRDAVIFDGEPHFADIERLSALDHLLMEQSIASAAGTVGAVSRDRLRAIAEELIKLNASRHRSWFHLGFLDVIEGREPEPDAVEASERDRGWYFAGAIRGFERKGKRTGIVALFDRFPTEARRLLGDRHEATGESARALFEALCDAGRRAEAVAALAATAVSKDRGPLFELLLEEAKALLSKSKAADAMPVVARLVEGIDAHRRRNAHLRAGIADEAMLLRALALRLHGGFEQAAQVLAPLRSSPVASVAARAASDSGLIECRIRSLNEVRLPATAHDLAATARSLVPGLSSFERGAAPENPHRAQADYALGVFHLASGDVDAARVPLERATAALLGGDAVAEGHGVLPRARLYVGLALAESLDVGRAGEALDHTVEGARALREEVRPYLLARTLTALATTSSDVAARAIASLYEIVGERLLDAAAGTGLLSAHADLREALAVRMEDPRRSRVGRSSDASGLLRDSLACSDVSRATRALSTLEELADDADGRARLLRVLSDRSNYDPAWDAAEALDAKVRLFEAEGRYAEAANLLTAAAHEVLSKGDDRGLAVAEGLVDRIDGYGIAKPDVGLSARIEALHRATVPDPPRASRPTGRVYFVGGNEVQARYEPWLRDEAARRWPDVSLDFDFTGWSSNWGRELPRIETCIADAGAVVVMRYIRTMLGRAVRETCGRHGKSWVACTGHGRESMMGAIERAVACLPAGD